MEALRAQAETARVIRECECGCATIDMTTDPALPPAEGVTEPNAVEAPGRGGEALELILFVRDGRLSSLEIVSYDVATLEVFPPPSEFGLPRGPGV